MLPKNSFFSVRRPAFINALAMSTGLSLLTVLNSFAQSNHPIEEQEIFTVAEQAPEFVGGLNALLEYLRKNRQYPPAAKAAGVSGLVSTRFIILSDGRITDVRVLQGLGHGCDEEAVRLIQAMPNWQPARQSGRPVNYEQRLAISFGRVLYAADSIALDQEAIFTNAEQSPAFPGGIDSLRVYLRKNLQYPPAAKEAGVSGRVLTEFIVRRDGLIANVRVLKGIGFGCDEEAVQLVSALPNWQPARQRGRPVNFKYNLPISFGLAQGNTVDSVEKVQAPNVDHLTPKFPGGKDALDKYISKKLRYPPAAQAAGVSGKVMVGFAVRNDGQVTDVRVMEGIGFGCDKEALRLIRTMPRWIPGKYNLPAEAKVSVHVMPIVFGASVKAADSAATDRKPTAAVVEQLPGSIFTVVEQQPEFTGGVNALRNYLRKTVQYPAAAKAANVSGRVFVTFIVRSDGRITDVQLLKGIGHGCDEEAVRVVSAMPNWRPGRQSGRPVNVKYNMPIQFVL